MAEPVNSETASADTGFTRWTLPLFLTRENKYFSAILIFGFAVAAYLLSNHFPLFPPQLLPMTWLDRTIPLIPNTVWIYTSEGFLFLTVYALCKDMANANKYLYSFLSLQIVSVIIFWIWPTTYPRDLYPIPADVNALTYYMFHNLRDVDTPGNCCPSLHVSSVYLSSFMYLDEQREKFPFFFLWATAVAVSTLTTKQHYLIDVVTGLLMAVIFYWIFHRYVSYRARAPKR